MDGRGSVDKAEVVLASVDRCAVSCSVAMLSAVLL